MELCLLERLQVLHWSPGRPPQPQLLDVVWCSAAVAVVVVQWTCKCGVVYLNVVAVALVVVYWVWCNGCGVMYCRVA